ncbi:hypothetical protein [Synergistes jonesii]
MHKEEIRFYNGRMIGFRLPTDEELAQAENDALDKKTADEDYEVYA